MNMSVFTYRCPGTGMPVQGWADATGPAGIMREGR